MSSLRAKAVLSWKSFIVLLAIALTLGGMYRFTDLAKKPMHTDEAILALKTQEAWRDGRFEYDPKDYHGPFLHQATQVLMKMKGLQWQELTETELRSVTAIFGFALILVPLLYIGVIGKAAAVVSSLLIATSPMMNYYSRYYIMEMPFVMQIALCWAFLWYWTQTKHWIWMVLAGVCVGWMHATKETFVINMAAMFGAALVVRWLGLSFEKKQEAWGFAQQRRENPWKAWILFIVVALVTSIAEFSNGFREWTGVRDSVLTYWSYLHRSGGSGHEKPWWYYLQLLVWKKDGFIWTEALSAGLALIGGLSIVFSQRLQGAVYAAQMFLLVQTLLLLVFYSLIPYKTPWSVLAVNFSLALLAGIGVRCLFVLMQAKILRAILTILFALGIYHYCQQTNLATDYRFAGETRYAADQRNPYAYSHTTTNLLKLVDKIKTFNQQHVAKDQLHVEVIQREYGWPLPWYWRDLQSVGYQATLPENLVSTVYVIDWDREAELRERLAGLTEYGPPVPFVTSIYSLRPQHNLALLVRQDVWDAHEMSEVTNERVME